MKLKLAESSPAEPVEFRGTELSPTMARTLMRARAFNGTEWTVFGNAQTVRALARRGMLTGCGFGYGTVTPQGIAFFSHLIDRAGVGR